MSYVGSMEGEIYSHCFFYESARRVLSIEELGGLYGGISVISLTAFMIESYFNLCCKLIFDKKSRVNEILDDRPKDLNEKVIQISTSFDFKERVAIAYGFTEQQENLIMAMEKKLYGRKKKHFQSICKTSSFYEIDDEIRFSPIAKFKALSKTIYFNEEAKTSHLRLVERLFSIRNRLAHGRSELVKKTIRIESASREEKSFSPNKVPIIEADWQQECSLSNAKEFFYLACSIINFISLHTFKDKFPFMMPTQVGAFSKG